MYVGKRMSTFENKCLRIFNEFYNFVIEDNNPDFYDEFVDIMLPLAFPRRAKT